MKRHLTVLCLIGSCIAAIWVWYENQPGVAFVRMLDLPRSMRVHNSWVESRSLFYYMDACCDIQCTEKDFRSWQDRIHGESVSYLQVRFPTENMPPEVQGWWTSKPSVGEPMFQAKRGGVTVVALWRQGRAFVEFGQRGKWE
jgi:hypothetical protein